MKIFKEMNVSGTRCILLACSPCSGLAADIGSLAYDFDKGPTWKKVGPKDTDWTRTEDSADETKINTMLES